MIPLALAGLGTTVIMLLAVSFLIRAWWTDPFPAFGLMGGAPDQPIDFPHTVHVQDAGIQCEFCHRNVTIGDAATVPSIQQCMFCHTTIVGVDNPEIEELRRLSAAGEPIDWKRVHILPDHVQFAHEPHLRFFTQDEDLLLKAQDEGISPVEATCSICHGMVREMEQMEQVRSLKMGDCVACHRQYDAPTDCAICHY